MLNNYGSCSFIGGIDFIIVKNVKNLGNPGSAIYKKAIIKNRKIVLNEWFSYFSGLHNIISDNQFNDFKSYDLECKSAFCCLLLDISKSEILNKNDLKMKLEMKYDVLTQNNNSDIYSIILFLILLQNTKNTKFDGFYNTDRCLFPPTMLANEGCFDYVSTYPSYVFSWRNLPDISKMTPDRQMLPDNSSTSFMPDLSGLCSIKRSTFLSSGSSGYMSSGAADTADDCSDDVPTSGVTDAHSIGYPFSQRPVGACDNWEDEFMEEWVAFQEGRELPKRFIWEERGRNVGAEKPRMTEWHCPLVSGNGALCLALYEMRYGDIDVADNSTIVDRVLSAYAVPMRAWISELILLRLGVATSTFVWDADCNAFQLACAPPQSLQQQFAPHLRTGTIFARLRLLADGSVAAFKPSMVRDGLLDRLRDVLAVHREVLTTLDNTFDSVLEFDAVLLGLTNQMEYLGDLFSVSPETVCKWPEQVPNHEPIKQGGIALLQYLYSVSVNLVLHEYRHITVYLLDGCLAVVLDQLHHWIYTGQLAPVNFVDGRQSSDFLVSCHPMEPGDEFSAWWWHRQYQLCPATQQRQPNVAWLFDELANEILRCGKSIRLLGLIDDRHPMIRNTDIIRNRPPLQLHLTGASGGVTGAQRYAAVVESVAAESLRSLKEVADEKRNQLHRKAQEAQNIRDRFIQVREEQIEEKNADMRIRKRRELDRLRNAADAERARRRAVVEEEKRLDMALLENSPYDQRLVDELKYELTKSYARKIEDAESREQAALNRIRQSESQILKPGTPRDAWQRITPKKEEHINIVEEIPSGDSDISTEELSNTVKILSQPRSDVYTKEEHLPAEVVSSQSKEIEAVMDSISMDTHHDIDNTSLHIDNRGDQHMENFNRINVHGHTGDSTLEKSLYPDPCEHLDEKQLGNFHRINNRYAGDSPAENTLYDLEDNHNEKHLSKYSRFNIHGHMGDSTAEKTLYPGSHDLDDNHNEIHMNNFNRINVHGHTGDSTAAKTLYPGSHDLDDNHNDISHMNNFNRINVHGHTGDSTAEKTLYPDTHELEDHHNEKHLSNFNRINVHGHTGDSSAQELLYPESRVKEDNTNQSHVDHFKSINVHGHVSKSTVQQLMYPEGKNAPFEQMNNSSLTDIPVIDTNDMQTSVMVTDTPMPEDPSNWLSAIKRETYNRSQLLKSLLPPKSYSTNRKTSSDVSSLYQIGSNDIYRHCDRSILSMPVDCQQTPEALQRPLNIDTEPIDVVINKSIVPPIMSQVKVVDTAIMYSILTTFKFCDHLKEIRKYIFLEDGQFSSSLLPNVFALTSVAKWTNAGINRVVLADLVKSSVNCSHTNNECLCANVSLGPGSGINPHQVKYHNHLDDFCVSYTVPWPLNIVIKHRQISQYQAIFKAISQIKYAGWCLARTRQIIKSWYAKMRRISIHSSFELRRLYSCLSEMEHWVRSIDSSLGNQGSGCGVHNWHQMIHDLDSGKTSNLDSLIESHSIYLDGVMLRCVLAGDETELLVLSEPVKRLRENIRKMIIDVLGMCSTYYRLVSINHWHVGDVSASSVDKDNNSKIVTRVSELHHKFKQYGECLLRVIKGSSQDSYLDHLFVSLDYNGFYYRTETF